MYKNLILVWLEVKIRNNKRETTYNYMEIKLAFLTIEFVFSNVLIKWQNKKKIIKKDQMLAS